MVGTTFAVGTNRSSTCTFGPNFDAEHVDGAVRAAKRFNTESCSNSLDELRNAAYTSVMRVTKALPFFTSANVQLK